MINLRQVSKTSTIFSVYRRLVNKPLLSSPRVKGILGFEHFFVQAKHIHTSKNTKNNEVKIIYSPKFLLHKSPRYHPERPERISETEAFLRSVPGIEWAEPSGCSSKDRIQTALDILKTCHRERYIEEVRELAQAGGGWIDDDTFVCLESYEVALLAVTAWFDAVDSVLKEKKPAFALARPPGHHATKYSGMGFCLFNNAVAAAKYAVEGGCERVFIFDWDVHHGNGIADIAEDMVNLRYCSIHELGNYPGTGRPDEKGKLGNLLNIPLQKECGWSSGFEEAFLNLVIPFMKDFQPDLVIVSAGYDALHSDPLGHLNLVPDDFRKMTALIKNEFGSNIMWGLEGGYDVTAIPQAIKCTLSPFLTNFESLPES